MATVTNIEIAQAGRGLSIGDLARVADNFTKVYDRVKPPLKLKDRRLLAQSDGQPSLGWVSALKAAGGKLLATFRDVPASIARLLEGKRYKSLVAEIYHDFERYGRTLAAVTLSGADVPVVKTLDDLDKALASETFSEPGNGKLGEPVFITRRQTTKEKELDMTEATEKIHEAAMAKLGYGEGARLRYEDAERYRLATLEVMAERSDLSEAMGASPPERSAESEMSKAQFALLENAERLQAANPTLGLGHAHEIACVLDPELANVAGQGLITEGARQMARDCRVPGDLITIANFAERGEELASRRANAQHRIAGLAHATAALNGIEYNQAWMAARFWFGTLAKAAGWEIGPAEEQAFRDAASGLKRPAGM